MKISVITVTYNSASTIEDTLRSVLTQDYPDIEYIIIDGLSEDNTMSLIYKHGSNRMSKILSERDQGLYYAINKGIQMSTGDVVAILHSDDFYIDSQVLGKVIKKFEETNADAVYADLYYVKKDNTDKIVRKWKSGKYKPGMFLNGWMPPHPAFFLKKICYTQFGLYNTSLRSSADYELMLRMIYKHKIKLAYLPEYLVKMRTGGQSNASVKNRLSANNEDRLAWQLNELEPRFYTFFMKPLRKLFQFI